MISRKTSKITGRKRRNEPLLAEFGQACGLAGPMRFTARSEDGDEFTQAVDRPFALIGRGRQCDLVLESRAVTPRHLFVQAIGERVFFADLGSRSGTRTLGERRTHGWLDADSELQIGAFNIHANWTLHGTRKPQSAAEAASAPNAFEIRGESRRISEEVSLIGRASPCAFRGNDLGLATYHAALVRVAGQLWIIDLRSGKGTRLNGRTVRVGRLRDGDFLEAGGWSAVARVEPEPASELASRVVQAPNVIAPIPLAPFQHMMEHFQQWMMMMGEMFTMVQQEHMAMSEQISQLREMTRELLDRRAVTDEIPWADDVRDETAPGHSRLTPKVPPPTDESKWREAHAWFNERLAQLKTPRG